ncbi:MAG: Gfo/Idh/MocA family oxidoreductase [Candidatus Sumerlaeota bacterium]|nr:Gfo/Idh/MocA family oxidoreductase [Candidatus Sumerlaeota bacterium]
MPRDLTNDPVRLGILGCGSFMQRRILTAAPETPAVRVVNLQKRDAKQAAAVASQFGVPRFSTTREELLADREVEAVFIGTPNALHEEDALACAAAGKHVLCEKPMALTPAAMERMIAAFVSRGLRLNVGHCLRFKPAAVRARKMRQGGELGELRAVRGFYSFPLGNAPQWRTDWAMGGGALRDLGVHIIDFMRFVSGQNIVSVSAMADSAFAPEAGRADRTLRALMRLESGAMAELSVSYDEPFLNGFEIVGVTSALIGWRSYRQSYEPGETLRHVQDESVAELRLPAANVYADELMHFARVLAGQETSSLEAAEALAAGRVIEAIYQSVKDRKECMVQS